jgi:hypothetical protein
MGSLFFGGLLVYLFAFKYQNAEIHQLIFGDFHVSLQDGGGLHLLGPVGRASAEKDQARGK